MPKAIITSTPAQTEASSSNTGIGGNVTAPLIVTVHHNAKALAKDER